MNTPGSASFTVTDFVDYDALKMHFGEPFANYCKTFNVNWKWFTETIDENDHGYYTSRWNYDDPNAWDYEEKDWDFLYAARDVVRESENRLNDRISEAYFEWDSALRDKLISDPNDEYWDDFDGTEESGPHEEVNYKVIKDDSDDGREARSAFLAYNGLEGFVRHDCNCMFEAGLSTTVEMLEEVYRRWKGLIESAAEWLNEDVDMDDIASSGSLAVLEEALDGNFDSADGKYDLRAAALQAKLTLSKEQLDEIGALADGEG